MKPLPRTNFHRQNHRRTNGERQAPIAITCSSCWGWLYCYCHMIICIDYVDHNKSDLESPRPLRSTSDMPPKTLPPIAKGRTIPRKTLNTTPMGLSLHQHFSKARSRYFLRGCPLSGGAIFLHITQLKDVKLIEIALNA